MHQTSAGRKAIYIPHSVLAMPLDELASRLAAAVCSLKDSTEGVASDPVADAAWQTYVEGVQRLRRVLIAACERGELKSLEPMFHTPCSPDEAGAVVLVDEATRYLVTSGVKVRITRHPEALAFIGLHPDELVRLEDVAHLVARAMHPETDDDEEGVQGYGLTRCEIELRINRAAVLGELQLVNPRGRVALSFRSPDACVTAGDLCTFFGKGHKGMSKPAPEMLPEQVVWNGQTYQPDPHLTDEKVEAARLEVEAIQDAERRGQVEIQDWVVKRPQRLSPYGAPLYKLLHAEWLSGRLRRPTSRDVLDAWSTSNPPEILEVMQDGLKYYDSKGDVKTLSLAALKEAIARMTPRND